jgi:prevent-host-death family protein
MSKHWALQEAKNRFSELVNEAIAHGPQTVTRHGRAAVVVVSAREYRESIAPRESLVEFLQKSPLAGLKLDTRRSRDTGRKLKF